MSTRMKIGATLAATAVGCSAGVFGAAGAASAATAPSSIAATDTVTNLPYTGANGMVVDLATSHIFISGAVSSSVSTTQPTYVEVLNLSGEIVGAVTGQNGASGLALSADGSTLYVADEGSNTITAINANTLAQTASYPVGATSPSHVAVSGGNVWFTVGSDSNLHELNLSTGTVSATSVGMGAPGALLAASPSAPNVLVAGALGGTSVSTYDVASGTPVATASGTVGACENLEQMQINPDGESLDMACGYPYYGFEVPLDAPTTVQQTYTTGAYPESVAVSADGEVLVGTSYEPNSVYEFNPAESAAISGFNTPTWGDTAEYVAWGADDTVFYSVVTSPTATYATFHTFDQLGQLALTTPAVATPGTAYTVSGELSLLQTVFPNTQVKMTRSINGGAASTVGTFTTNASGRLQLLRQVRQCLDGDLCRNGRGDAGHHGYGVLLLHPGRPAALAEEANLAEARDFDSGQDGVHARRPLVARLRGPVPSGPGRPRPGHMVAKGHLIENS